MLGEISRKDFIKAASLATVGSIFMINEAQATTIKKQWILHEDTFKHTVAFSDDLAEKMRGSICYVTDYGKWHGVNRIHSMYVRSYTSIPARIESGDLGEGDNVVYCCENGNGVDVHKQTPIEEQIDFENSVKKAADLAHSVNATITIAPAGNIMTNIDSSVNTTTEGFLKHNIPQICARYGDSFDIQAQQGLQDAKAYGRKVRTLGDAARLENPNIIILAGLTTNSPKSRPDDYPTWREISAAAKEVWTYVDGFWMNVPPHRNPEFEGKRDYRKARWAMRDLYGLPVRVA